jgi:hypothetical protein
MFTRSAKTFSSMVRVAGSTAVSHAGALRSTTSSTLWLDHEPALHLDIDLREEETQLPIGEGRDAVCDHRSLLDPLQVHLDAQLVVAHPDSATPLRDQEHHELHFDLSLRLVRLVGRV